MIEVDVFWSFAMGATFAASGWHQIRKASTWYATSQFTYVVVFLATIFAPSGIYLLWAYPGWESMFLFKTKDDLDPILPCIFSSTNVLLGIVGFMLSIRSGSYFTALTYSAASYVIMFAILGFGYARFMYAGTGQEWAAGVQYPLLAFFGSPVFWTLIKMAFFMLPGLYYPMIAWPLQSGITKQEAASSLKHYIGCVVGLTTLGAICYIVWVVMLAGKEMQAYLATDAGPLGYYAPVVGFIVAESAFAILGAWPFAVLYEYGTKTSTNSTRTAIVNGKSKKQR